jgi:hypothetical protein
VAQPASEKANARSTGPIVGEFRMPRLLSVNQCRARVEISAGAAVHRKPVARLALHHFTFAAIATSLNGASLTIDIESKSERGKKSQRALKH